MTRLSVIIPALNEAERLPELLDALNGQTRPPDEVIVADAGSRDETVAMARARNARVVPGGMPGVGRNAGAREAQADVYLFLDADVLPHPDFIALALDEFERRGYGVATCPIEALSNDLGDRVLMDATNLYIQLITPISPRAPGFCIFARCEIHQAIGGFDESLKMSEDHDYVRRACKYGTFGFLTAARIPVSMRRLEKEGLVGLALKYMWCEMYALAGKPIRSMPFEYEFGSFQADKAGKRLLFMDIAKLRRRLGRFENPILALSSLGLEQLRRISELDPLNSVRSPVQLLLERHDLELLEGYLQRRLAIIRKHGNIGAGWKKIKSLPGEIIHILDISRLPALFHADQAVDDDDDEVSAG